MEELAPNEFEKVKKMFRDVGCDVTDVSNTHFEVVCQQLPVLGLVHANPYFLEFTTLIWAKPKTPWSRFRSKRDALLNEGNQITNLVKLTCDANSIARNERAWEIHATAKIVTGRIGSDYDTKAVENWLTLWLQDIANIVLLEHGFEVIAMMIDRDQAEEHSEQ